MSIAPGTRLDRYEVRSLLGAGGMGDVYLASDSRLGRSVALKVLPPHLATDAARKRRFIHEAKAASALNHPNILVVHEIVADGPRSFIVTEFVEGVTLRERLRDRPLSVSDALDIAAQIASALAAAHAAGVVHRDIKPENIMIRPDGVVKVLDFGLARSVDPPFDSATQVSATPYTPRVSTLASEMTGLGVVLGTVGYMSPEQARGQPVDQRADVFACGAVLYEMVVGRAPFRRETASDTIAALLTVDPTPLTASRVDVPDDLERIVHKALAKLPAERHRTAGELCADLSAVRRALEWASARGERHETREAIQTSRRQGRLQGALEAMRRHAYASVAAAVLIVLAAITFVSFSYATRAAALTDKDTILLADLVNTTGDPVFDETLKQGLAVQLSQSPFLAIFPEARIEQALRFMGRSVDAPVTRDIGREICQRQGLKAFVTGAITKFDRTYAIVLEAVAAEAGQSLAITQVEANGKDQVLNALSRAAAELRGRLGESLGTIQKFDAPLEATTSSLEALKAFSLGSQQFARGDYRGALPFFERATELDPNFARAWMSRAVSHYNIEQHEAAARDAITAFLRRDHASELEKLRITAYYHGFVTGDVLAAAAALDMHKVAYPRDPWPRGGLSAAHLVTGEPAKAIAEARDAIALNPNSAVPYANLATGLRNLRQLAEAERVVEQALTRKLVSPELFAVQYEIAFLRGDTAAMGRGVEQARGFLDEHVALVWQARASAATGHVEAARELTRRAMELATAAGANELAARYAAERALRDAAFAACPSVRSESIRALALDRSYVPLTRAALALAMCGEEEHVQPLIKELESRYPQNTRVQRAWLPCIRAAVALGRRQPAHAARELAGVGFEYEGELWPQYVRATAFLQQRAWPEAMADFKRVVDERSQAPLTPLVAPAYLGWATAAAQSGNSSEATRLLDQLLAFWKDADPDIPILSRARADYRKLRAE